jgi:hypothetical protein
MRTNCHSAAIKTSTAPRPCVRLVVISHGPDHRVAVRVQPPHRARVESWIASSWNCGDDAVSVTMALLLLNGLSTCWA